MGLLAIFHMVHVIFGCENYMGIRIVLLPDEELQASPAFEGMLLWQQHQTTFTIHPKEHSSSSVVGI